VKTIEAITLGIAVLGAALGIINTWHSLNQSKPRLRVRFLNNYALPDVTLASYSIEVINLSSFPLTVREIGFSQSPFWVRDIHRAMALPMPEFGHQLPYTIEPRQQANFFLPLNLEVSVNRKIRAAYVKTDCGLYFRGTSPALFDAATRIRS
jgi:hypothetical protein